MPQVAGFSSAYSMNWVTDFLLHKCPYFFTLITSGVHYNEQAKHFWSSSESLQHNYMRQGIHSEEPSLITDKWQEKSITKKCMDSITRCYTSIHKIFHFCNRNENLCILTAIHCETTRVSNAKWFWNE